MTRYRRRLALVVVLPAIVAGLSSCRGASQANASSDTGPLGHPTVSPGGAAAQSPVVPPGGFGKGEGKLPDLNAAPGQLIVITDTGIRPALLVSTVELGIRWRNETSSVQRVLFDNGTVDSGQISPGESFTYTPTAAVSITYQVLGPKPLKGVIQVEPPLMPGEKPFKKPPKGYPSANWPYTSPTPAS